MPVCTLPPALASPLLTSSVPCPAGPSLLQAIEPTDWYGMVSLTDVQEAPRSLLSQTPPVPNAAKTRLLTGSCTRLSTRPATSAVPPPDTEGYSSSSVMSGVLPSAVKVPCAPGTVEAAASDACWARTAARSAPGGVKPIGPAEIALRSAASRASSNGFSG